MSRPPRFLVAASQVLFVLAFVVGVYVQLTGLMPSLPTSLPQLAMTAQLDAGGREDRVATGIGVAVGPVTPSPGKDTIVPPPIFVAPAPSVTATVRPPVQLPVAAIPIAATPIRPTTVTVVANVTPAATVLTTKLVDQGRHPAAAPSRSKVDQPSASRAHQPRPPKHRA